MGSAKEEMLSTIRDALSDIPDSETSDTQDVERNYLQKGSSGRSEVIEEFIERVGEYKAEVRKVKKEDLKKVISDRCKIQKVEKLVVPIGFQPDLLPDSVTTLFDDPENPLSHKKLDESDGVITTCAFGVSQTGTIILDAGPGQGRRALTLVPDYHMCIITEDQIKELIPEGFAAVKSSVKKQGRPITFISGPSATSDIELSRVEGVHGPRRLEVLVVGNV